MKGEKRVLLRRRQVVVVAAVPVVERDGGLLLKRWTGYLWRMLLEILWMISGALERGGMMLRKIFFFGRKIGFVVVGTSTRLEEL